MRRLIALLFALLPAAAFAGQATDANWPRVTILPLPNAPVIDGQLGAGEWEGAVALTGFEALGRAGAVAHQPVARLAWSPEALLVAAEIPSPPGQRAKAAATDFDGTVWNDDSVEVHLDRGHGHAKNHQFVVNALGTRFDSLAGDAKWNARWEAKAQNNPGKWSVEFAIPWAAVGGAPAAGGLDGFNILINSSYLGGSLTYSPLRSSAHDTASYAHLLYGDTLAVSVERLDAAELAGILVRGLGKGTADVQCTLERAGGPAPVSRQSVKLAAGADATLPLGIPSDQGGPKTGQYTITLSAAGPAGLLLSRRVSVKIDVPLKVRLAAFTGAGQLKIFLAAQPSVLRREDTTYDITVSGPAGVLKRVQYRQPADAPATAPDLVLSRDELPAGKLTVKVVAANRATGFTHTVERTFDNPLRPEWLGTREGLTDKVPAPWTPLVVRGGARPSLSGRVGERESGRKGAAASAPPLSHSPILPLSVKPWGRVYEFARGLLPSKVVTRQASVLAAPIALKGSVDGQPLTWSAAAARTTQVKPNVVTLAGTAGSGAFTLSGTALVEYDGMVRVDLTLTPAKPEVTVQELTLEMPLRAENAKYLYHFPGRWGSVDNSGAVPTAGWNHAFKPFVWLGDEDRGFSWFCESDENWFPHGNPKALAVDPAGPVTTLRCHLIAAETRVSKPLKYTFGFQATPVKQPEKTVWDYRITHQGNYGLEEQRAVSGGKVTYPAARHLRREEGTFECWIRPAVDSERPLPLEKRTYQGNRSIFTVELSPGMNGSNYGLYWNGSVQGLVGWARTDGVVTANPGHSFDWKAGEWHHVAMTWDKEHLRIYLDGKMVSETPNNRFLAAPLEEARLMIGGDETLATIDEVRILSVARPPVPQGKPYEADAQTLLLDHFEDYAKAAPAGKADPWLKFAPGKFGQAPTWEPQMGRKKLEELARQGVRTICFHEHWVPYQSYPHPVEADEPRLRSLVDGCHAQKINLLLYMSRQFADNSPEWEFYSDEACSEPRPAPYTRAPEQRDYIACWAGPYKEFSLYWLGKTMDRFGNDGWYLDGPEWPMQCANRSHGCGYLAPDGTFRPTWDIFATRDFMKRLYILTRSRKPEGQLNIHNSTVMTIPTLGWGTSSWGGEQIDTIKPPAKTLDFLPMDAFRTEFMGRQWGVPAEFLVYDGMPYYAKDVLAYTLLHGVLIRPGSPDSMERISALWKVHDRFPFSHAKMYPYWNNADVIGCAPAGVYATAYERLGEGLLVFASNLGDSDAQANLSLQLAKFRLGKTTRVTDALTGEVIAHENGVVKVDIASWRYRVLRVAPK